MFLTALVASPHGLGVARACNVLDPSFGFGKALAHKRDLHRNLPQLRQLGFPGLVGWWRKPAVGTITDRPVRHCQRGGGVDGNASTARILAARV
jgi:dihydropteroate synthase